MFLVEVTRLKFKIITPNNVAIYGTLCALATYDRQELKKNVIQSRL